MCILGWPSIKHSFNVNAVICSFSIFYSYYSCNNIYKEDNTILLQSKMQYLQHCQLITLLHFQHGDY